MWFAAYLALVMSLALAAPVSANVVTLGSDMQGPAAITESRGADTAFWAVSVAGKPVEVPEDGQVMEVRIRGSAMREQGAANDPATLVHFQSLGPAGTDGARTIHLTSAAFYMPVDQPDEVSIFRPENLCVPVRGAVAFNTIGGFRWGGAFGAPLSDAYYNGTPWRIFGPAGDDTATAWYSHDQGTNNGAIMTPAGGADAGSGQGAVMAGKELLMQFVVATGADRSEACGGPRRHADGSLVDVTPDAPYLKVIKPQRPYVSRDRRFAIGIYCGGDADAGCAGRASVWHDGRRLAREDFQVPKQEAERVGLRLRRPIFRRLDRTGALRVRVVLRAAFGVTRTYLTLRR